MTIKEILNNAGLGQKVFERFHHPHNPGHGYHGGQGYNYHPAPNYHSHPQQGQHIFKHYSFKHNGGGGKGGGKGGGAALSALTLLSFLFFLNILQQCLKDQMTAMNPQVMVMTAKERIDDQEMKESKITPQQHTDTIRGIGQTQSIGIPTIREKTTLAQIKNHEHPGDIRARVEVPTFVYAMGDGIGEIINEQK